MKHRERWVLHPESTKYSVSDLGNVKRGDIPLNAFPNNAGYLMVNFNGKKRFIHRLVVETFIGVIPSSLEVDHRSREKTENTLKNLRVVSHRDNLLNRDMRKK